MANTPRRILVSRLRFLGDIVLCTPLLDLLRTSFPSAAIDFLGAPSHVDVLEQHPSVDDIHRLPSSASTAEMLSLARRLRAIRYDVAIDLFGNPRSALLTRATGAPLRIGGNRGLRSRLFTHRRGRPDGNRSAILHHLDKIRPLLPQELEEKECLGLRTTLALSEAERAAGRDLAHRHGLDPSSGLVVLHPGSTWPDKGWPEERWPDVVDWLSSRASVAVIEPPGQPGLAARVCQGTAARPLPVLEVRQVLALLAQSRLYVGNDGGILHAAVALGVATLGLFGPTEPEIWFPYESWGPFRVLHRCDPMESLPPGVVSRLHSLEVLEVVAALEKLLETSEGSARD